MLFLLATSLHAQQPAATPADPNLYRAARTPVVTLTLGTPSQGSTNNKLAKLATLAGAQDVPTTAPLQPQVQGGVFSEVSLGYLTGGNAPLPATVTLQFDASRAGATVWVQPMDGGAILTQDAKGNPVSSPSGCALLLNSTGQLIFSFQAPARTGRYQVLIRLDSVSSTLPFVILDPSLDN